MAHSLPSNPHDYLKEELHWHAKHFDAEASKNYKGLFWLRLAVIALSALTTIAVGLSTEGWKPADQHTIKNVALILSAAVTAFAAWETFWNYRALWVRYRLTAGLL